MGYQWQVVDHRPPSQSSGCHPKLHFFLSFAGLEPHLCSELSGRDIDRASPVPKCAFCLGVLVTCNLGVGVTITQHGWALVEARFQHTSILAEDFP